MGRLYTVRGSTTVTNAGGNADLVELLPAANKPILLRGLMLSQISEVGDAAEEGLEIDIVHMTATVTSSNGTATTPSPVRNDDTAAGFTCDINGATVATTTGTTTIKQTFGWNIRSSPLELWWPDPAFAFRAQNAEGLFVRMNTTPADDFTLQVTAWIEEL